MSICLSAFDVGHYRGLDGLSLPRLGPANLITGRNGAGKTALIEAIWLFTGRYNPGLLWNVNVLRTANPVVDPVSRLSKDVIELRGTEKGKPHELKAAFEVFRRELRLAPGKAPAGSDVVPTLTGIGRLRTWIDSDEVDEDVSVVRNTPLGGVLHENPSPPDPRPNCIIDTASAAGNSAEIMQRYSELVKGNRKQELIRAIGLIDPDINDVEILTDEFGQSGLSVSTTNGSRRAPADLGGGFARLFATYLSFFGASDGIVLVDELENGIHHSVLPELWRRIRDWMKEWNVQVFATTHSAECVDAATAAFAGAAEDLCVHKLYVDGKSGEPGAITFTGETLEGARDLDLEVR